MNRKDSKIQEENIAAREKGLIIVREFERVVGTFNKVLKYKDDCAKSMEVDLRRLVQNLQDNLDNQHALDRNFEIYDSNIEKILLNLQQVEGEERAHAARYERLLKGIGIEGENQESETSSGAGFFTADNDPDDLDTLEKLRNRREHFLQNLNHEFKNLEEKLASISKLKNELESSRDEIREKKAHALEKKEALEGEGKKLLNEVGRLETELETTLLEEKNLIEQSAKIIEQVENSLELDEKTDHVLFSSLSLAESAETSSNGESPPSEDQ